MATCVECKFFVPCTPETCYIYSGTCGHCHVAPPRTLVDRMGRPGDRGTTRCGYPHVEGAAHECAESKPIDP